VAQRSDHDRVRADSVSGRGGRVRRLSDDGHQDHVVADQRGQPALGQQHTEQGKHAGGGQSEATAAGANLFRNLDQNLGTLEDEL